MPVDVANDDEDDAQWSEEMEEAKQRRTEASMSLALDNLPFEVFERIVLATVSDGNDQSVFLGPPSHLVQLLLTNRRIYSRLSFSSNPHLYATIFASKFDQDAILRRSKQTRLPSSTDLAVELRRRILVLKTIRATRTASANLDESQLRDLLWTVYVMLLENAGSQGRNYAQLRNYAFLLEWLKYYCFGDAGASGYKQSIMRDSWPEGHECNALAMWIFWLFLKDEDYGDPSIRQHVPCILKLFALGAHRYPLTNHPWHTFTPHNPPTSSNGYLPLFPSSFPTLPPIAPPSILAFLTLANKITKLNVGVIPDPCPLTPPASLCHKTKSEQWDSQWARLDIDPFLSSAPSLDTPTASQCFPLNALSGNWEGLFTYLEFINYVQLLGGAPPSSLQRTLVVRHRQNWKLAEWYLCQDDSIQPLRVLSAGDPLRAYIPPGTKFAALPDGASLEVSEPGHVQKLIYRKNPEGRVVDIIVTGQGHSAWGQFQLIGRIRPCDGFVSLSKEYVNNDRGRWLYRGYIVGDTNGYLVGRWRETVTNFNMDGYEGCFVMNRRKSGPVTMG